MNFLLIEIPQQLNMMIGADYRNTSVGSKTGSWGSGAWGGIMTLMKFVNKM
jgi:hypothetical protein